MDASEIGQRVRVNWSGRNGTTVAFHEDRLAPVRVHLDGEKEDRGFNPNELTALPDGD